MSHPVAALVVVALAVACSGSPFADRSSSTIGADPTFLWFQGTWHGVRIDAADGSAAPMSLVVRPMLGGNELLHELEVEHANGIYRGLAVDVFDATLGVWERRHVNATRRSFTEMTGEPSTGRVIWSVTSPTRTRESTLTSEQVGSAQWRRTMRVSDDGGAHWRVLWIDELHRG